MLRGRRDGSIIGRAASAPHDDFLDLAHFELAKFISTQSGPGKAFSAAQDGGRRWRLIIISRACRHARNFKSRHMFRAACSIFFICLAFSALKCEPPCQSATYTEYFYYRVDFRGPLISFSRLIIAQRAPRERHWPRQLVSSRQQMRRARVGRSF